MSLSCQHHTQLYSLDFQSFPAISISVPPPLEPSYALSPDYSQTSHAIHDKPCPVFSSSSFEGLLSLLLAYNLR